LGRTIKIKNIFQKIKPLANQGHYVKLHLLDAYYYFILSVLFVKSAKSGSPYVKEKTPVDEVMEL
jgi:hypothetical protein